MNLPSCIFRALFAAALCIAISTTASAQTAAEDFEDGSLSPFAVEKLAANVSEIVTPSGFPARAGTKVNRIVWLQANYDGTRAGRSVEGASTPLARITGEGWYGFSLYAPAGFPVPGKRMVLGQIICWHSSLPNTNITITVSAEASGQLVLEGAYGVGDGGKTTTVYATLAPALTKGSWHDFVIYCKFSRNNTGVLKAWMDGAPEAEPTASFTGINLGNGAWTSDTLMTHGGYIKWGPYCWDYANYTTGESREIFYDEIAYQVGNPAGAFDLVKPAGYATGYAPPPSGATVMTESYDTLTTGTEPSGWTLAKAASTALTVRDIPSATDKCMQFWDGNATGRIEARKSFAAQAAPISVSWSFMQNGAADGHRMVLLSGASTAAVEILTQGGNLVYRNGAGTDIVLQAIPASPWYDVEVVADPTTDKADVYVNGLRKLTGATFRNAVASIDGVLFGTGDASATWHLYINDVVIARVAPVLTETFDAMPTNARPSEWTVFTVTSSDVNIFENPSATDKSMRLWDGNATGYPRAEKTFVAQTAAFAATWSYLQSGPADGHRLALKAGETAAVELYVIGGNLVYRNGAGTDLFVQAVPASTWYDVKVAVRPAAGQADVYVNNMLKVSNASLRNPVGFVDRTVVATSDASATYHLYVKKFTVDRAVTP